MKRTYIVLFFLGTTFSNTHCCILSEKGIRFLFPQSLHNMHELCSTRQGILVAFSINDASARINQKERRVTILATIEGTFILGFGISP